MIRRIILILLLSIISLIFIRCGSKNIVEKSIYNYKTDYVGDNTKVGHIIKGLPYKEGVTVTDIELMTDQEQYGIQVFIQHSQSLQEEDFFKNVAVSFALIGNLDKMEYVDSISKEILFHFDRESVDKKLEEEGKISIATIGSSKENVEQFLE